MRRIAWISLSVAIFFSLVAPLRFLQSSGTAQTLPEKSEATIQRLQNSLVGRGHLKRNRATGLIDFVRLDRSAQGSLAEGTLGVSKNEKSREFLMRNGRAFGLLNPAEDMILATQQKDLEGEEHLTFNQTYQGVPVFAGVLKMHFNRDGELRVVNGVVAPDIELNPRPSRTSAEAAAVALTKVQSESPKTAGLMVKSSKLLIYRTGLAQGIAGENHLVWEIVISNNADVREFVYIDAHSGKFVDQLTGTYEALDRRVYDGQNIDAFPPPGYPANPFWVEGQPFPTGIANGDEVIASTKEAYDLYRNAFGRDSFDDLGSTMFSIFDSAFATGNAFASPANHLTVFSKELTADDVIAHEWTHVYTYYTDSLIYQWQPGALNEAYSDIFGETVDLLNGRGLDTPGGQRQPKDCLRPMPTLHVNSPAYLQGDYATAPGTFGPPFGTAGISGKLVLINDGSGVRTDGCQTPFLNAAEMNGKIALIDRSDEGTCTYSDKVKNAQLNGAIAVIIANDAPFGDSPLAMLDLNSSITIPSALIGYSDGQALRAPRARTVNITIKGGTAGNSVRWLIGEDSPYQGFRDMWNPRCYANPGKVSDKEYFCGTFDQGGVHQNSGIPNHAYALLVDGGNYNGQAILPIGFTKAAHIYFRAMSVYQTPTTDFADHAEALEASASDLIGVNLPDLMTGLPAGQVITATDAEQVHNATLAVEMRTPPVQCGFKPLLAQDPPADMCPGLKMVQTLLFGDDFESDPLSRWRISRDASDESTFTPRNWTLVQALPDGRTGSAFFALDPLDDCTRPEPGEAGVLHLESPVITLPRVMSGGAHLSFEHWVATEQAFDGGQVMISVNGGPFRLIGPSAFIFNPYNTTLFPPVPGMLNPRAGQPAFTGVDGGSVKGSWGKSIVDLTGYATPGDRVKFRWDFSTDYCFGTNLGWYIDNVRVYACRPQ